MHQSWMIRRAAAPAVLIAIGAIGLTACDRAPSPPTTPAEPRPSAVAPPATQPAAQAASAGLTLPNGTHLVNTKCPASGETLDPKSEELVTFVHDGKTRHVLQAGFIDLAGEAPHPTLEATNVR